MAKELVVIEYKLDDKVSKSLKKINKNLDRNSRNLDRNSRKFREVGASSITAKNKFNLFATSLKAFIAFQAGRKLGQLAVGIAKITGSFQANTIAFEVLLRSEKKAHSLMQEIVEFAAKTPFQLPELIHYSKGLLAVGIQHDEVIGKLKTLGDIAAGVGKERLPTIVRSYQRVQSKGRATMEEINMLMEANVPILATLSETTGLYGDALFKFIRHGKAGLPLINEALAKMTAESGLYFNMMARINQTIPGLFSNLLDNITRTGLAIGSVFRDDIMAGLNGINNWVFDDTNIMKLKNMFISIRENIRLTISNIKIMGAALEGLWENNLIRRALTGDWEREKGGSFFEKMTEKLKEEKEKQAEIVQEAEDQRQKTLLGFEKGEEKQHKKKTDKIIKSSQTEATQLSDIDKFKTDLAVSLVKKQGFAFADGKSMEHLSNAAAAAALFNFPLAAMEATAAAAYVPGLKNLLGSIKLADGGVIPAAAGGVGMNINGIPATVSEAGQDEVVIPLSELTTMIDKIANRPIEIRIDGTSLAVINRTKTTTATRDGLI